MAQDKKSFLLYCDLIHTARKLTSEQRGDLFLHILEYVNDENPTTDNLLLELVFEPIKQGLKRDLKKYEQILEKRKLAGQASAYKRQQTQHESTSVDTCQHDSTLSTDSVSVSVNVSDTDNVSVTDIKEDNIFLSRDHLSISWGEMNKLIDKYGDNIATDTVNRVLNYRKNAKYKSLYLTAISWIQKDIEKNKPLPNGARPKPKVAV